MWRETGAGTVTNKSPSMTAFCWSISFSYNIMVCYCPLSVLSVPESILNEGQLHLAAIFQLSPRCHGNPVVSRWTCRWRGVGGGEKGSQCCKRLGCQGGEWEEGQHLGPRDKAEKKEEEKKNRTKQVCHTLPAPDKSAILQTIHPPAADSPLQRLSAQTLPELSKCGFCLNHPVSLLLLDTLLPIFYFLSPPSENGTGSLIVWRTGEKKSHFH